MTAPVLDPAAAAVAGAALDLCGLSDEQCDGIVLILTAEGVPHRRVGPTLVLPAAERPWVGEWITVVRLAPS